MRGQMLGYWVTDDPHTLEAFIKQAREHYAALEQALEPINEAIADLETDWTPRPADFWQGQTAALPVLRQATKAALQHFAKEQSSEAAPVPLVLSATSIGYTVSLLHVKSKIEEAGILLTAHSAALPSLNEAAIRQRQRVLQALREVVEAGREATSEGHAKLDTAPQEQQKLTAPRPARQSSPPQPEQPTAATKARRPALRVVRKEDATS